MAEPCLDTLQRKGWLSRSISARAAPDAEGPLAGLSYVAKDLFDVVGLPTVAGSSSNLENAPADADAEAIIALSKAGARLIALSNMDPLAYGFITDNPLYGTAHNPHDQARICGGSSGGSAGAVASGLVDFALGTDTSGSIRVPAAFTGLFGLKPTAGLFASGGVAPLSPTLDRVGVFARDGSMLSRTATALSRGRMTPRPRVDDFKIARLCGYFSEGLDANIFDAVENACASLGVNQDVTLFGVDKARAAAYIIVAHEAAQVHARALSLRRNRFDDATRARLVAASAIPEDWVADAHAYRAAFTDRLDPLFDRYDFLIAPTVPCVAPLIAQCVDPQTAGAGYLRATLGVYTQPISLTGFPVLSVPICVPGTHLPTALQIIARPGRDADLLTFANTLPPALKVFRPKLQKDISHSMP